MEGGREEQFREMLQKERSNYRAVAIPAQIIVAGQ